MMSLRHSEEPLEDLKTFPDPWATESPGGRGWRKEGICKAPDQILRDVRGYTRLNHTGNFTFSAGGIHSLSFLQVPGPLPCPCSPPTPVYSAVAGSQHRSHPTSRIRPATLCLGHPPAPWAAAPSANSGLSLPSPNTIAKAVPHINPTGQPLPFLNRVFLFAPSTILLYLNSSQAISFHPTGT